MKHYFLRLTTLIALFYFITIKSACTQAQSINIDGVWEGIMTHETDGYTQTWQLVLTFEQKGSRVRGTTKIIADDRYGVFALTGSAINNQVSTIEGQIVDQKVPNGWNWCMARKMQLIIASQNKLEGSWTSQTSGCSRGKITAYRTSEPAPPITKIEENPSVIESVISGQIFDKQTRKSVKATLSIIGDKSPMQTIPTRNDGKYSYNAPISDISDISITEDGYEPLRESINIDRSALTKNFFLIPKPASVETNIEPKRNEPVILKNVLFKLSTATLLPQSFPELDRLASLMQNKPTMKIRLEGHTDRIGDAASNLKLSQDRVGEVKRYLIQKGILDTRIMTKGYGDTRTICSPPCEANRRVEFVVTEQ